MEKEYDIIIVGSGPSGLTLAECFSSINKSVLLIDREAVIGGCHRVQRVKKNGELLFTEHGPRIYSSTYINTAMILEKLGTSFNDIFTLYNFSIGNIGNETIFSTLNYSEILKLTINYFPLIINSEYGIDISMKDFAESNGFSKKSIEMIDRICRITDGADISRYTLNEFYNLLNQNAFYSLYQPKLPTDVGLFKIWENTLKSRGVEFMNNTDVISLNYDSERDIIKSINVNNGNIEYKIFGKDIILAIPPENFIKILDNNSLDLLENQKVKNAFGDYSTIKKWSKDTEYIDYISVTFHWDKQIKLPDIYGFSKTSWGLVFIELSKYMMFNERSSKTVISVAVSNGELKSDRINKTANECNEEELIEEMFYQLSQSFPNGLERYTVATISPNTVKYKDRWINTDSAYISSSINPKTINFRSSIRNLYTVGTHTGKSFYKFTSMESAITNSLYLAHEMYPELKTFYPIRRSFELNDLIKILVIIIILYFFLIK